MYILVMSPKPTDEKLFLSFKFTLLVGSFIANVVVRDLCETLRKTGASAEITCTTMQGALKKVVSKFI